MPRKRKPCIEPGCTSGAREKSDKCKAHGGGNDYGSLRLSDLANGRTVPARRRAKRAYRGNLLKNELFFVFFYCTFLYYQ